MLVHSGWCVQTRVQAINDMRLDECRRASSRQTCDILRASREKLDGRRETAWSSRPNGISHTCSVRVPPPQRLEIYTVACFRNPTAGVYNTNLSG